MNDHWRIACFFPAVFCSLWGVFACGQELKREPAGAPRDHGAIVARDQRKDPAPGQAEKDVSEEPVQPEDPAVAAILVTRPSTPGECVRAAKILSDLKRPDLAKQFLQKVIDAKLDGAASAKLAEECGSAVFVQLSARADLAPQARQLADAVLSAQNAALQNPERLAELIKEVQDSSPEKRNEAFSGLMAARGAGVAAMIEVLADSTRASEHAAIRTALTAMGRQAVDPLLAALELGDTGLQVQAIAILGAIKAPQTRLFLLKPFLFERSPAKVRAAAAAALQAFGAVPSKEQAVRMLIDGARNYFNSRQAAPGIVEGKVEAWNWDEEKKQFAVAAISAGDAARRLAARLAADAFAIAAEDPTVAQMYLATLLEEAAYRTGLSKSLDANDPAVQAARQLGPKAVESALAYAMQSRHAAAATAAAQILGQIGKAEEVLYEGPKPAPLALALRSPERRVRMAAARAIVSLGPQRPYAGSSYLVGALEYFASSSGMRRALLAGPNVNDLRKMVSALAAAGLKAETATNGRDAIGMAASSPDYELALVDAGIDRPPIDLLLQQLRHDERTTDLRVGVIARDGFFERAQHVVRGDPLAKAFARPHDDATIAWQLEQLAELRPDEFVTFEERQLQAAEALQMLAELSQAPGKLYNIRQAESAMLGALNTPSLSRKAIAVLAAVNSPEAQRALVKMAGRVAEPLEVRQAAVSAFRQNIQAHGILLTTDEIRKQYQEYNQIKDQDPAGRKILGLILDCLEAPTKNVESEKRVRDEG